QEAVIRTDPAGAQAGPPGIRLNRRRIGLSQVERTVLSHRDARRHPTASTGRQHRRRRAPEGVAAEAERIQRPSLAAERRVSAVVRFNTCDVVVEVNVLLNVAGPPTACALA